MSSSATRIEPAYVLDTHALIWYLRGSNLLSAPARAIFRAAELGETRLCASSISVAARPDYRRLSQTAGPSLNHVGLDDPRRPCWGDRMVIE